MHDWLVEYEVRRVGAIGVFYPLRAIVQAESEELAKEAFCKEFGDEYELNGCVKVVDKGPVIEA